LAALCATLRLYRDPEAALTRIPTLAALTAPSGELEERVGRLHHRLQVAGVAAEMQDGISQVGGGSLPGEELPTSVLAVDPGPRGAAALAQHLRVGEPSIWTRVHRDRVLIDLRTVTEPECDELEAALLRWLQAGREGGTGQ
ncbi:MAG: L-seryl-tRNA(Sec) selenium transferase, partial [Armatimonadetes bacterium]|nr:L-seryl-tRNA(Sec) selenium transferase [Armatimonadota bacterium]